jgi:uncharacterized YccA/Bax inhibitor family protein
MRSGNPVLSGEVFTIEGTAERGMTVGGTVNKTGILLVLVILAASWTWNRYLNEPNPNAVLPWMLAGGIGGFVVALITAFRQRWSPVTGPLYAVLQGLFIGGVSSMFEQRYPGIVVQAVALTFGTLVALLAVYKSGLVKVTDNLRLGIFAATGGIMLIYLVTFVLSFFGVRVGFIHDSGTFGILFSLAVVTIAALNLVLDFDFIEQGAASGSPKYMEWYGAFGLIVTLVWLYLEILRLLMKMRDRQ